MVDVVEKLHENDYKTVIELTENIGNNPSREEIELIILAVPLPLPANTVTFYLLDDNHSLQVNYIHNLTGGNYYYVDMTMAS